MRSSATWTFGFTVELQVSKGLQSSSRQDAETLDLLGMAKAVADVAQAPPPNKKLLPEQFGRDVHDHEPRWLAPGGWTTPRTTGGPASTTT